ncbi:MAG: hypothetical protein DRJ03_14235, partial [Chloroflexi bacterium]
MPVRTQMGRMGGSNQIIPSIRVLKEQQFPLWGKSQVVAAISQSRRALYAEKQTRFGNRGYKTGIA